MLDCGSSSKQSSKDGITKASIPVAQGAITGYFKFITVLDVPVGQDIKATIDFYAINPGAWFWKTFLIAHSNQLPDMPRELDATIETGEEGGRYKVYNLGPMPDDEVIIGFFLFAHDDSSYDWSWSEYLAWLEGLAVDVQHLDTNYITINPADVPIELETMEIDISPDDGGYVTTVPASQEGVTTWHNNTVGNFIRGTSVQVTAHPHAGYKFEKWSDEISGGVNYQNPAFVQLMTEHRAVKAHFDEIEVPSEERLEIDITPSGSGTVTVDPQPVRVDGDHYYYEYGTEVMVTAHPKEGYGFSHWSDEITGGVNYSNPAPVKVMTENRSVKAHFKEIEIPSDCTVDEHCPTGYICEAGVCVVEGPPPPPPPIPPEEKKKFPLGWTIVGAGGLIAIVGLASGEKK